MSLHQPKNVCYRLIPHVEHRLLPSAVFDWVQLHKTEQGEYRIQSNNHEYLLITLGMRPNPGHKIEIVSQEETEDGMLLYMQETLPQTGMVYPQIVISLYLLLEIYQPVVVEWVEKK